MSQHSVSVTIVLPQLLHESIGQTRIQVRARTLKEAFEQAYKKFPALKAHLRDESGRFRSHVLCFHNETNTRDMKSGDVPLSEGDEITIVQAISGG